MTARADILNNRYLHTPAGQTAFQAAGTSDIAEVFGSFVGYASTNWNYAATAPFGQKVGDVIDGDGTKEVACGTLREAFKIVLREDCEKKVSDASFARFMTRRELNCFDPKVKGNVGYFRSSSFNLGCYFSLHFFIEYDGKFFDPCLMATYATESGPALAHCRDLNPLRLVLLGTGRDAKILRKLVNRPVPGFDSAYEMIAPHQLSEALSPEDFKTLKKDVRFTAAVGFGI